MAIFSANPRAIPALFLHGWPGSVVESLPLMLHLKSQFDANPAGFGYHIIVPSLIGFGWSSPPPKSKDFRFEDNARLLSKLMTNLGFSKTGYVAQGGDIGSFLACHLAAHDPACKLVHVNLFVMSPPEGFDESRMHEYQFSDEELMSLQRGKNFVTNAMSYALIQATRPSTVGIAIGSSPVALLAWIGEKMIEWSDQTPTLDLILTNVCLYWFSECLPKSLWSYRQTMSGGNPSTEWKHVNAPMGFSAFKYESSNPPKAWTDSTGKVKWYRWYAEGGRFAALERPMVLWGDVVEFIESMDMFS
ncbi:EHN domain-containing protein [Fusarium sp. LHS14.1]|nr:EHN domain-containing protein [Fusarium sp. LHS14.1]